MCHCLVGFPITTGGRDNDEPAYDCLSDLSFALPSSSPVESGQKKVSRNVSQGKSLCKHHTTFTDRGRGRKVRAAKGEGEEEGGGRAGRYDDEALWLAANWTDPKDRVEPLEPQGGSLAQWARIRAVQACKQAAVKK